MASIFVSVETNNREHSADSVSSSLRPLPDLEVHLGYWLRRVSNHVSGTFTRALHARQVSVAEWVALHYIRSLPEVTPGELAHALGLTRGAVSKVLDKLEGRHWIARVTKPDDNRVQLLSLRPKGRRVLPDLASIADRNDQRFFGCLSPEERATLKRLLQKLTDTHQFSDVPIH